MSDENGLTKFSQGHIFIGTARAGAIVAGLLGPLIGGYVLSAIRDNNTKLDSMLDTQNKQTTALAVFAQQLLEENRRNGEVNQHAVSIDQSIKDLIEKMDRLSSRTLCLENKSVCRDRS